MIHVAMINVAPAVAVVLSMIMNLTRTVVFLNRILLRSRMTVVVVVLNLVLVVFLNQHPKALHKSDRILRMPRIHCKQNVGKMVLPGRLTT